MSNPANPFVHNIPQLMTDIPNINHVKRAFKGKKDQIRNKYRKRYQSQMAQS